MKKTMKYKYLIFTVLVIFTLSCKKDKDEENDVDLLSTNYSGHMEIYFSNTYPPFSASTQVEATIDKDLEVILFETGTLSYSGDTIIDGDSRITRAGNWIIEPVGFLVKAGDDIRIDVDAGITIVSDIQKIYAWDDVQWVLVSEVDFASTPNADIFFSLNDAVTEGSTMQLVLSTGSIRFSLYLTPTLTP